MPQDSMLRPYVYWLKMYLQKTDKSDFLQALGIRVPNDYVARLGLQGARAIGDVDKELGYLYRTVLLTSLGKP